MRALGCAVIAIAVVTSSVFAQAPNPKNVKQAAVHARQGKAYFDAKQYDEAIAEFKKSYELDGKSVTLFKIASAFYAKGDMQGAIEYYGKYLQADPDGPLAQQALEFTTIANKQIAEAKAKADAEAKAKAEAEAKAAAAAEAERKRVAAEARVKQAEAFAQAGAWVSAGDEYKAASEVGENPDLLITAAEAYAKQDHEKARAAYQAYLAKVPLGGKSDEVRAKVAELTRAIDKAIAEKAAEEARLREEAEERLTAKRQDEEKSDFELAASFAPGVKLHHDNPVVIALRGEAALRIGRRVNLGIYAEYGRIDTTAACGTSLPGPDPATDFDFGPRNSFSSCSYFLPGLQLYVHVLPKNKIDPYIGVAPGFRFGSIDYTTVWNGMETTHSRTLYGITTGFRAGVTYHLSPRAHAWSVGGFIEGLYQWIGDDEGDVATGSYLTVFVGGRSTVTF